MVILVDYQNSGEKEDARKIIDKICESYSCEFFDLEKRIAYEKEAIPSLEFVMLKNSFDSDIPAIGTDVVIDNAVLQSIIKNFDGFQRSFISKMLKTLGVITVFLYKAKNNSAAKSSTDDSFWFCLDREFFVDLKKMLDPRMQAIKDNPLNKLLSSILAYGFYIGSCGINRPPTKTIVLSGGAGQKISYEEYANWALKNMPLVSIEEDSLVSLETDEEDFAFVRQHHPVELIAKKIVKEKKQ